MQKEEKITLSIRLDKHTYKEIKERPIYQYRNFSIQSYIENLIYQDLGQYIYQEGEYVLKKEDIRILWNEDEDGKIVEYQIAEFNKEKKSVHLYEKFTKDIGNCLMNWNEYRLEDIFFIFCAKKQWKNRDLMLNFLEEITNIKGFQYQTKKII